MVSDTLASPTPWLPRLTNAFIKKVTNHEAMTSLHFCYDNLCRAHQTLDVTPAMESGITDHAWTVEELVGILEAKEAAVIGPKKTSAARTRKPRFQTDPRPEPRPGQTGIDRT